MTWLNPDARHPMTLLDGTVVTGTVYLKAVINHPRFTVGDFSYASSFDLIEDWAQAIAPYLFPISRERLIIGRFCQIAHGVRIITSSANHPMAGFSTYPFRAFRPETMADYLNLPYRDTVIGNDVWIGMNAMVMPGVSVGDGAIIASGAVVTRDVAPYTIVGGNPAQPIRRRFDDATVDQLLRIRWWDWEVERIEAHLTAIEGADLVALQAA